LEVVAVVWVLSCWPFNSLFEYIALSLNLDKQAQVSLMGGRRWSQVFPFGNAKGLHDLTDIKLVLLSGLHEYFPRLIKGHPHRALTRYHALSKEAMKTILYEVGVL
jgi:hypothetical protein